MSKEEDFACDKFLPQRWRKDICRTCYQPLRLHEKKTAKATGSEDKKTTTPISTATSSPATPSAPTKQPLARPSGTPQRTQPSRAPPAPPKRTSSIKNIVTNPSKPLATNPNDSKDDTSVVHSASDTVVSSHHSEGSATKQKSVQDSKDSDHIIKPTTPVTTDDSSIGSGTTKVPVAVSETSVSKEKQRPKQPPPPPKRTSSIKKIEIPPPSDSVSTATAATISEEPHQSVDALQAEQITDQQPITGGSVIEKHQLEVVEEQPQQPEEQPQQPEEQPQQPEEQPQQPEEQPQQPEEQPQQPEEQPQQPEEQPQQPEEQPQQPEEQPQQPEEQPQQLEKQPQQPEEQPQQLEEQPQQLEEQPQQPEEQTSQVPPIQDSDEQPLPDNPSPQEEPNEALHTETEEDTLTEDQPPPQIIEEHSENEEAHDENPSVPSQPVPAGVPPPPPPPPPPPSAPLAHSIPNVRVISIPPVRQPGHPPPPLAAHPSPPPAAAAQDESETSTVSLSNADMSVRQIAMEQIRSGVQLRPVSPPVERAPTEEKVVDVASELRQMIQKKNKKESQSMAPKIEEQKGRAKSLADQLYRLQRSPSYLHALVSLLESIREFQQTCGIPVEMLVQKLDWPVRAIDSLQEVVELIKRLENHVVDVERLCNKTLQTQQVNVEIVKNCVTQVMMTAKRVRNEHDQETRSSHALNTYPVNPTDIHRLLRRAGEAVVPLLDKLYEKALQSHALINDPSVSKFDLNFRLQNAQRLLRMCCQLSDSLAIHLEIQRHSRYSEVMLKTKELEEQYRKQMAILEKKGEWDEEEEVVLVPAYDKRSPAAVSKEKTLVTNIVDALTRKEYQRVQELVADGQFTSELCGRTAVQLIKVAIASGSIETIDAVIKVQKQVATGDDDNVECHNFVWLNEAIMKGSNQCLEHLINVVGIPVNCQSSDIGNSALHVAVRKQDWGLVACLIRLGADPLQVNNTFRNPLQLIALKNFPQQHFPKVDIKELPFDMSNYINNPSLSDAQIVTSDGDIFYIHRLVFCGQSPVFKSLLESEYWATDSNKVTLPTVSSRTLKLLLQYLYTGQSTFNQDDLNTWIDLLAAADQYLLLPLKTQCESVLSGKIDHEVVVPMLHAAARFNAQKLLINCCNHLFSNYSSVEDSGHEAILYVLENILEK